jgi:hypothetical protein
MTHRNNPGARLKADIRSYEDADRFLGNKDTRQLAANTWVQRSPDEEGKPKLIVVVLHRTSIVSYFSDGRIMLNSGGYETATTKDRINKLLPPGYSLYQEKNKWWLEPRGHRESRIGFYDGMVLSPFGGQWGRVGFTVNPGKSGELTYDEWQKAGRPAHWPPKKNPGGDSKTVRITKKDGEYRVPGPARTEAQAYYTTDRDDAMDTALDMWKGHDITIVLPDGAKMSTRRVNPGRRRRSAARFDVTKRTHTGTGGNVFDASDEGLHIDGANGERHAVSRMLDLLQVVVKVKRIGNLANSARNLIAEQEDAGVDDELIGEWLNDATEVLQHTTADGLVWRWEAGDLALVDVSEEE